MPKGVYPRPSAIDRFWNKVSRFGPIHPVLKTRCWIWIGLSFYRRTRYGQFIVNGRETIAHRFSYDYHVEKIPKGLCVLHKCDNQSCVRPDHLFLGTALDNARDRDAKGRRKGPKGIEFPHAKLTEDIVREIRKRHTPFCPINGGDALAREFGVSPILIRRTARRELWKHVE